MKLTDTLIYFNDSDPTDRYQAVGRGVHMDYVQEHLKTEKKINFGDSQELSNGVEIEILADTVYVKVRHKKQTNIRRTTRRNNTTATRKKSRNKTEQSKKQTKREINYSGLRANNLAPCFNCYN